MTASADIRQAINAAISIKIIEPVFESQTKTKLGSTEMEPDGVTVRSHVNDFLKKELDNYLHRNTNISEIIEKKIKQAQNTREKHAWRCEKTCRNKKA